MALTRYKLVGHEKLKGLQFKGDFIPLDKIDDTLADKLYGKTHVLVRLEGEQTTAPAAPVLAEAVAEAPIVLELGSAPAEAAAPRRTRTNS